MQHKVSSQHRQTKPVRAKHQSRNEGVLGFILSLTLLSPVAAQATTIGLHTWSYHDRGVFNNDNYGLYLYRRLLQKQPEQRLGLCGLQLALGPA